MTKIASYWIFVTACTLALSAGCAKKEMIRADEQASATAPSAKGQPDPSALPPTAVAEEGISPGTVGETPLAERDDLRAEQLRTLEAVYFSFDSFTLTKEARDILYRNAGWLEKNPQVNVQLEGHTDERGSGEYNLALGEKRALSAQKYLRTLGIAEDRLSVISYGEEKPAASGHDETAWSRNRRVEFVIK
ncbi:peptidoglycan-associated lipoprotein Pal [Geobacter sp. DSM 9736]|uniref:peptidoglycan-associated lipoprotein Pal n=1 Tax=Geobacter sp. DSM 9736 TaxID=1277350 RepID=UPI000B5E7633|nr:peptidoglycan-associated lipoprotein Pal [Geobacter sp. DSM 9736]SNB46886.1 peptidoglycan-associated lipoprotein [Geobacter sp. DSM 9736]